MDLTKQYERHQKLIAQHEAQKQAHEEKDSATQGRGKESQDISAKSLATIPQKQLDLISQEIIRPELNIARFASFIFISPYSKKVWEKRTKKWDQEIGGDGERLPASLTISPIKDRKTPTTTTYKLFLALISLWEQRGKPENGSIIFSGIELANELGLKWSGAAGKQIQRELKVLRGTELSWQWSFTNENKEKIDFVEDMNILSNAAYLDRDMRRKKDKFTPLHRVTFNPLIIRNLLAGITKPINYHTILSITGEGATALYTHLDVVMSNKSIWERTAIHLLDDLQMTGKRYKDRFARKAKLESWIKALDGKLLSNGKLSLTLDKTTDGKDWKLIARRVPKKTKNRIPKIASNAPELRQTLLEDIDRVVGGLDTHKGLYELFVAFYDASLIRQALSEYTTDVQNPRKPGAAFTVILHRIAHTHGKEWIKPCKKDCKYRPENLLL